MNQEIVKSKLELLYPGKDIEVLHRLLGGMSNYTYVIKIAGKLYTYRLPGEFSQHFVNREIEINNIRLMEKLNVTNKTVYFSIETGEKVARYVEGVSLNLTKETYPYKLVSDLLKKIHNCGLLAGNDYQPFLRLNSYETLTRSLGYIHSIEYYKAKEEFLSYQKILESIPLVLCHGDSQPSNFVYHENHLITVDFEYCGNGDPIYDIACFANLKLEDGEALLKEYFPILDKNKWQRFYLWRAFQCLQWHNVALFKEIKGLSEALSINFKLVADNYLLKAQDLLYKVLHLDL